MPVESIKLFLTKLIDYAGLFPPAKLELESALKNYSKYIQCNDNWMMSQFIIPVHLLEEITAELMVGFSKSNPLKLSILSGELSKEVEKLNQFQNLYSEKVYYSGLETRIQNRSTFNQLLDSILVIQLKYNFTLATFFELPPCENWVENMKSTNEAISQFNKINNTNFGFKLRCGGVEAHMFPSADSIAETIISCINFEIPIKFTAGLHHPIRHYNESLKTKMYGFFNIFIGGMLTKKYGFDSNKCVEILKDESLGNFKFSNDKLSWKEYSLNNFEIKHFRKNNFISFGSCSFNEPREDLIKLGII